MGLQRLILARGLKEVLEGRGRGSKVEKEGVWSRGSDIFGLWV